LSHSWQFFGFPQAKACGEDSCEPTGIAEPVHDKAMPLMPDGGGVRRRVWLNGTFEEALKLQMPQLQDTLVIVPYDGKKAA